MATNATIGTKNAVRDWAELKPTDKLALSQPLDDLRPSSHREKLRDPLNREFKGETGFPISAGEWAGVVGKFKIVQDVRDEVVRRLK
jgi:hypothetical protein